MQYPNKRLPAGFDPLEPMGDLHGVMWAECWLTNDRVGFDQSIRLWAGIQFMYGNEPCNAQIPILTRPLAVNFSMTTFVE